MGVELCAEVGDGLTGRRRRIVGVFAPPLLQQRSETDIANLQEATRGVNSAEVFMPAVAVGQVRFMIDSCSGQKLHSTCRDRVCPTRHACG